MIKFLTEGVNPQGECPTPPMPTFHLYPEDARAIALYLKSIPGGKKEAGGQRNKPAK
jgi:hypothetical protein